MSVELTVAQANRIAVLITYRQVTFPDETLHTSVMVALLNAGDEFTSVSCVAGEWSGVKGDLSPSDGVPRCPNGHVLMEASTGRKRLGYVDVDGAVGL